MNLVYWDSSAVVAVCCNDPAAVCALEKPQIPFTRPHTIAEVFSQLTGGRLGRRLLPGEAAAALAENLSGFNFVDLSNVEIMAALERAQSLGIRGGIVHDYLHAVAAEKSGANFICTYSARDFALLTEISAGIF